MATNPQADGMTKITLQVSEAEKASLQELARQSKMKLSAYIRYFLEEAVAKRVVIAPGKAVSLFPQPLGLVAEDQAPYYPSPAKKKKSGPSGPTPPLSEAS